MTAYAKPTARAALYSLVLLLSNMVMALTPGITRAEGLQEGIWNGTYDNNPAQYLVTNSTLGKETIPAIKIILTELDLIFEINNIQIKENSLSFTIQKNKKENCTLQNKEDKQYVGNCKSDAEADSSKLIDISMHPPVAIKNENPDP